MSNKENYKKAFSVLKSSGDFSLEEKRMEKMKREKIHKNLLAAAAVLLVIAVGSGTAYAADLGGIRETVHMWVRGNKTDVTYEFNKDTGNYVKEYVDENGEEVQEDVTVLHGDHSPLTEEELIEHERNELSIEKTEDGKYMLYFQNKAVDITDKFTDGKCYIHVVGEEGEQYVEAELDEKGNLMGYASGPKPFVSFVDRKGVGHMKNVKFDKNGNVTGRYKKYYHEFIEVGE